MHAIHFYYYRYHRHHFSPCLLLIFLFFYLSVCVCVFCSFHFFSSFMLSILLIIHPQPFNNIVRLMCNIYNVISLHKDLVLQGKISWTYLQNIFKLIVDTKCLDMYISCIWYMYTFASKRRKRPCVCAIGCTCDCGGKYDWRTHSYCKSKWKPKEYEKRNKIALNRQW